LLIAHFLKDLHTLNFRIKGAKVIWTLIVGPP
jgi:hypothetical protein